MPPKPAGPTGRTGERLGKELRSLAAKRQLSELIDRGIDAMPVVRMSQIVALVEQTARARQLTTSREIQRLREELASNHAALAEMSAHEDAPHATSADQRQRLAREMRAACADLAHDTDALAGRLLELAMAAVDDARASSRLARDHEVDVLERRIAKLRAHLEDRERDLASIGSLEGLGDGIASMYRVVQGLANDDPQRDRKRELMADLLAANLMLQGRISA